jgi:rhomboid protease GluP
MGGFIPAARFTTVLILLINSGLYVATALYSMKATGGGSLFDIDGYTLYYFGAKQSQMIFAGEWWRLVTAGFLHGGILHILMNSWVIFDLGATVEEFYGTARYLTIYVISTIAGFLLSAFWSPALSVGASAGLFGLIGAMIAFGMTNNTSIGAAMRSHYTQWAIWGLVLNFLPGFRIDIAAHVGGLAAGFVVGYIAGQPRLLSDWREKLWSFCATCSVLIVAASFALMFLSLLRVTSAPPSIPQRVNGNGTSRTSANRAAMSVICNSGSEPALTPGPCNTNTER